VKGQKEPKAGRAGTAAAKPLAGEDPVRLRGLLRDMLLIRRFEERAGEQYALGKIGGFCHLYIGQEAVASARWPRCAPTTSSWAPTASTGRRSRAA
jgi:TPP-dependent pyruvate/acetoin dehydrogenase alpha subunit